jgi:glucose/arabinose dehydrogenase
VATALPGLPSTVTPEPTPPPVAVESEVEAAVLRVVSGDEIAVSLADREVVVRYAGIDAPAADECLGAEALALNSTLVPVGTEVQLTVLRYFGATLVADVRVGGALIQADLLAPGFARYTAADSATQEDLLAAERTARDGKLGIWADCPILALGFHAHIVAEGLMAAVDIAFTPTGEILVAEKDGRIRLIDADGVLQPEPLLAIEDAVHSYADRGLLSIVLDPDFATKRYLYAYYTVDVEPGEPDEGGELPAYGRVSRFAVGADFRIDPASETILIGNSFEDGPPIRYFSHAGGDLVFAPDGSLLASFGEGSDYRRADDGTSISPQDAAFAAAVPDDEQIGSFRSQSLDSLAGKVVRIDPATGDGLPDNPFWTGDPTEDASKIFALGLRQPFRIALAPGEATRLIVGEVGYVTWEEINLIAAGDNAGWPCREGAEAGTQHQSAARWPEFCPPSVGNQRDPILAYPHYEPLDIGFFGRTLIGGDFYRDPNVPDVYADAYVFGDFAAGFLRTIPIDVDGKVGEAQLLGTNLIGLAVIAIHPVSGEIYMANVLYGQLYRVAYEP